MLDAMQRDWVGALYSGGDPDPGRMRGLMDVRRFGVYRSSLRENLTRALADTYPVVAALVGKRFFEAAALRYLKQHPSRAGDLHAFGDAFPAFLGDFEPARSLPYLPGVAQLEWLAHEAFHAADRDALGIGALASLSEADLGEARLTLHPSLRLMRSDYPVHRIWAANQPGAPDTTIDLGEGDVRLAIYRDELEIALLPLDEARFAFVTALGKGTLAEAYDVAGAADPAFDAAAALHVIFDQKLVVKPT